MTTYRYKQPPTVQAWQWDGSNTGKLMALPGIEKVYAVYTDDYPGEPPYLVLVGRSVDVENDCVDIGCWVVQELGKPTRSYTDAEFRATFEPAPSHSGESMGQNGDSVPLEVPE